MRAAVLAETRPRERRVALVPDEASKLARTGTSVVIESGAGDSAGFPDQMYLAAGAELAPDRKSALQGAALALRVAPMTPEEAASLPEGIATLSFLPPSAHLDLVRVLVDRRVGAWAFDLVPRISRAQSMDALSSQASVAGYQSVITAADRLPRLFPLLMTAAGTIPPAKVLVMGAGVAGLQAIATARRLGAAVSAYDVRPEAAEEVRSLGAKFVELDIKAEAGAGGYAAEQSADFIARQQELIAATVAGSDVVITTAAVPGRRAPLLLPTAMVEGMRPGSVVVDLAAASGGNCELSVDGEEIVHRGVTIIGAGDLASKVATHASQLYARNVANLLALLVHDGEFSPDFNDEVVAKSCVTFNGEVRHGATAELMAERVR